MKVTVTGITAARDHLNKTLTLGPTVQRILVAATAERLRYETRKRAPVKTGKLRDAGQVVISGDDISYTNPTPHAPFCEFGTGRRGSASWRDFYGRSRLEHYIRTPFAPEFSPTWPGMKAMPFIRPAVVVAMDALRQTTHEIVMDELK